MAYLILYTSSVRFSSRVEMVAHVYFAWMKVIHFNPRILGSHPVNFASLHCRPFYPGVQDSLPVLELMM